MLSSIYQPNRTLACSPSALAASQAEKVCELWLLHERCNVSGIPDR
jgi:hypothetical protein